MLLLDLLLHRYIRSGDMLYTYNRGSSEPASYKVRVDGFGKYAAVFPANGDYGAIRRDGITKNADGNWCYRFDN